MMWLLSRGGSSSTPATALSTLARGLRLLRDPRGDRLRGRRRLPLEQIALILFRIVLPREHLRKPRRRFRPIPLHAHVGGELVEFVIAPVDVVQLQAALARGVGCPAHPAELEDQLRAPRRVIPSPPTHRGSASSWTASRSSGAISCRTQSLWSPSNQ